MLIYNTTLEKENVPKKKIKKLEKVSQEMMKSLLTKRKLRGQSESPVQALQGTAPTS